MRHLAENKISYLGTIRINKRELPDVNAIMKSEPRFSSSFYRTADGTVSLTLYKAKTNKVVSLLSSYHTHPTISQPDSEKKKPDVIETYNRTKCGVDCFDAMARMYTTRCASRRWPLYVLFNVLDIAAINSWVLYKQATTSNISRHKFILQLIEELLSEPKAKPIRKRQRGEPPTEMKPTAVKRRRCDMAACNNKTTSACRECGKHCCGVHTRDKTVVVVCSECFE